MPLNCRATTLTAGAILKEEQMSSTVGERQFRRHFKRQFGRGQLRVKNCCKTVGSQFLPRGIKMPRRALWVFVEVAVNFPQENQRESNMHRIVVTILCRLYPPFPKGNWPFSATGKPPFLWKSYYFYRISCMNPLFSPTGKLGAKGNAIWWTSIRCMFDSL